MIQRLHSISVTLCAAILAVCTLLAGCPKPGELARRASANVPEPSGCTPDRGVCIDWRDAGVWVPAHCSASNRAWPQLPLDGRGVQRTCAPGEGCALDDAGRAHCTARDGGL